MFNRLSNYYDNVVLGKPRLVLALLLFIFVFFSFFVKDFKLDASSDSLMLENDEDLRIFREVSERYETRDLLFVTFTPNDDLFSETALAQIKSLRDELRQLTRVESILSILDVPLVKIVGGKLSDVAKNFRTLEDPTVDRDKAREELLESPVFKDTIISADAGTTMLALSLKTDEDYSRLLKKKNNLLIIKDKTGLTTEESDELAQTLTEYNQVKVRLDAENHENIVRARSIMAKYAQYGVLHLGGLVMISDDMISFIKNDLLVFGIGILVFLVIMLTTIFRQARFVILPLLSCTFAGLVMIGLLGMVGWKVTVISSNFISLMLILTMSMNVHLIVRYRQLRRDDPERNQRELVREMTGRMVWPCLYTALTTMIGFASLVVSGIKPVIDFGWMMTIGLGVTFLTSFSLFPAILMLLDRAKIPESQKAEVPFTRALAGFTERHGGKVLVLSVLLAVVSAIGISRLKVENSLINYFSDSTEIYQGLKLIDDKLGGTTPLDVILKFNEVKEYGEPEESGDDDEFDGFEDLFGEEEGDSSDAWFTEYKINRIKAVHDYLDGLPAVGKVLSLASLLRLAEDINEGEPFDAFELAIITKRAPDELKESMIEPYISIENNEARINLRILDSLENLRRNDLLIQINNDLQEKLGLEPEDFQVNGILVLYNNMLQSLFRSQILTLGVVMLGIALMLVVLFRSVSLAIIGIIPNLLTAAIILGLMGLMNIPLDLMTITIAAITIGIAVDNSIHYIYRFREEFPKHQDYILTMHYCHANIGRAVFYTAITIIVGFSIMVMSNFIPTIYFGLLIALAMFIALLAVLTLLPKLILIWKPF